MMSSTIPLDATRAGDDSLDVEKDPRTDYTHLTNQSVHSFSWEDITVTVKDRHSKQPLKLLSNVSGTVQAGMSITAQ
jgi:hypothetical protein